MKTKLFFLFAFIISFLQAQEIAILKYDGGGDWYANPTAIPNLIAFCNQNISTKLKATPKVVEPDSVELFNYPMVFMTGHGNVFFDENTVENLRNYLTSGGFLHISDNYGIDKYIRREMKKVFPNLDFEEIPYNHPIYHQKYNFDSLPKIHEHDNKPAQGFGIFYEGRLVCFYDYQCDLSDGWEDQEVHHDPEEIRLKALKMGANLVQYNFTN
jgi:hypothetical protein